VKYLLLAVSFITSGLSSSFIYAASTNEQYEVPTDIKSIVKQLPTKTVTFNVIPATVAARKWLKILDKNQFGHCWENSSVLVKKNLSKEAFIKEATRSRQPFGSFIKRDIIMSQPKVELPGSPKGKYVIIKFESEFVNKKKVTQTVIVQQDPDQVWRVAAYFAM